MKDTETCQGCGAPMPRQEAYGIPYYVCGGCGAQYKVRHGEVIRTK